MAKIIKVFEFTDYKLFVLQALQQMPKKGHGQFAKIAQALGVHTTMVTHIFKGELNLSPEQCLALAEFLGLNELETQYFVNLVQLARAGDSRSKKFFSKQMSALKEKALNLKGRLEFKNALDESDQAIYYSHWIYSAIRLLTAIPDFQSPSAIAEHLEVPLIKVNTILEFLISRGLCVERNGRTVYGEVSTYLDQSSPLVIRHHVNWRLKVIDELDRLRPNELAYTYPVVIAEKDFAKIRESLVQWIEQFKSVADPSPSEKLYCLNIDWLEVKK